MAKRNVGRARQTAFDKVLGTIPAKAEFRISFAADTTTAAYDDIDTNLDDGEAWLIYGAEYVVESSSLGGPKFAYVDMANAYNYLCVQVHRNDQHTALLSHNDGDLMFQHQLASYYDSTNGAGAHSVQAPFRFGGRTISFSEKLRVICDTIIDWAGFAESDYLIGCIYYDRITAPSIGQSKLGQIADL